jgi:hypothetical protein
MHVDHIVPFDPWLYFKWWINEYICTFIKNLLIHLTHDISPLIKLSFNTPKSTRGLNALSVTRSGTMHLTLTCEMHGSWIVQCILDSLRMVIVACYLVSASCIFRSWFQQQNPIVLWHTDIGRVIKEQRGYAAKITNRRYTRQTLDNTRRSLFLGEFRTYPS